MVSILLSLVVAVTAVVVVYSISLPGTDYFPRYDSKSKFGVYAKAAVSTDAAACAPIGRDILAKNGTAVDSAIAMLICMGLINPHSSGLGGGFLMTIYNRSSQQIEALDAREVAPAAATVDMFKGDESKATVGGLSIAVPGELAGYYEAHKKYGKLPWKDLFEPTIKMCNDGVPVNFHLANALRKMNVSNVPSLRPVFVNNKTGKVFEEGELMKRTDLAATLKMIANNGSHVILYDSNVSRQLVKEIAEFGGIITEEDLRNYKARWMQPVSVQLNPNVSIYSVPPPGSGAVMAFILSILSGYNVQPKTPRTKDDVVIWYHRVIEAFKHAYAKRLLMEDDDNPNMRELLKNLTSREYAEAIRLQISDNQTYDVSHYGVNMFQPDDKGTAHASVIDVYGNAVAVTSTVNQYFGSLRMSPSTGIIFNDEMDDFSSPNITNAFGVPPSDKNLIKPGRRPLSSMCPSIFFDSRGDVQMVIGGTGGTHITTGVALVSARALWTGDNIKAAIDAPRLHHQLLPNVVMYEEMFPQDILEGLQNIGHNVSKIKGRSSIIMGIFRGKDGDIESNADYRKGGTTDGI